jgi:hypothetical protein
VEGVVCEERENIDEIDAFDWEVWKLAERGLETYLFTGESAVLS